MIKTFTFRFLISALLFLIVRPAFANTFASLSPVPTEIIYALGAENMLLGVSSACDYPQSAKNKPVIGDTYFVNMEELVRLKPDYLFAMESARPMLGELSLTETKPVYFDFLSFDDIYSAIYKIADLANKNDTATALVRDIQLKISKFKAKKSKKILYVVQSTPLITIGNKSFITNVIEKAGHKSVSSTLNYSYPTVSLEFLYQTKPDVVVICYGRETTQMRKLLPDAEFVYLTQEQRDLINRPAPRVWQAVKFFAEL